MQTCLVGGAVLGNNSEYSGDKKHGPVSLCRPIERIQLLDLVKTRLLDAKEE